MKIEIKSNEGRNLRFWLPTRLFIHPKVWGFMIRMLNKGEEVNGRNGQRALPDHRRPGYLSVDPGELRELSEEMVRWSRNHPRWCLVDIQTADGERVYIEL